MGFPHDFLFEDRMVSSDIVSEEMFTAAISGSDEHVHSGHFAHLEVVQHLAQLARVPARPQKQS